MELKTFVAEALKEIIDGVAEAQAHAKGKGGSVNPGRDSFKGDECIRIPGGQLAVIQSVEFDVAVTATEGEQSKGGIGLKVWGIGAGGEKAVNASNQIVSRIKFAVPLQLPISPQR